jgi:hypothetical protein
MDEIDVLVQDLYAKYAPDEYSEEKVQYVKDNYSDPNEFARDFYGKYAPNEYSEEKAAYIQENYLSKTPSKKNTQPEGEELVIAQESEAPQMLRPVEEWSVEEAFNPIPNPSKEGQSSELISGIEGKKERIWLPESGGQDRYSQAGYNALPDIIEGYDLSIKAANDKLEKLQEQSSANTLVSLGSESKGWMGGNAVDPNNQTRTEINALNKEIETLKKMRTGYENKKAAIDLEYTAAMIGEKDAAGKILSMQELEQSLEGSTGDFLRRNLGLGTLPENLTSVAKQLVKTKLEKEIDEDISRANERIDLGYDLYGKRVEQDLAETENNLAQLGQAYNTGAISDTEYEARYVEAKTAFDKRQSERKKEFAQYEKNAEDYRVSLQNIGIVNQMDSQEWGEANIKASINDAVLKNPRRLAGLIKGVAPILSGVETVLNAPSNAYEAMTTDKDFSDIHSEDYNKRVNGYIDLFEPLTGYLSELSNDNLLRVDGDRNTMVGETIGQLALVIPTTMAAPAAALFVTAGMSFDEMYQAAKSAGLSEQESIEMGVEYTPIGVMLETWGANKVMQAGGKKFIVDKALDIARERGLNNLGRTGATIEMNRGLMTELGMDVLGGFHSEGMTEAMQSLAMTGLEAVKNVEKGENVFELTADNVVDDLMWSYLYGGAAGGVISGAGSLYNASQGIGNIKSFPYEIYRQSLLDPKLSTRMASRITEDKSIPQAEKNQMLATMKRDRETFEEVTGLGLNNTQEKRAVTLVARKRAIEDAIDGKDKALTKSLQEEVKSINEQLSVLGGAQEEVSETSKTEPKSSTEKTEVKQPANEDGKTETTPTDDKVVEEDAGEVEQIKPPKKKGETTLSESKPTSKPLSRTLKIKDGQTSEIQSDGEKIGEITTEVDGNKEVVRRVDIDQSQRGLGYGKSAYIEANKKAQSEGRVLVSDKVQTNEDATRVWDSLVKDGEARKLADGSYEMNPIKQETETTFDKEGLKSDAKPKVVKPLTKENKQSNEVVNAVRSHNKLPKNKRKSSKGISNIVRAATKLGYTVKSLPEGKYQVLNSEGKRVNLVSEKTESPQPTQAQTDFAVKEVTENGLTEWNGEIMSFRPELGISWTDIRKGEKDIKAGKTDTESAKRLVNAIAESVDEDGFFTYVSGSGGMMVKESVPSKTLQDNLTAAEDKIISENQAELAAEYDAWYDGLTYDQQVEHLKDINDGKESKQGSETEPNRSGKSKDNVSDKEVEGKPRKSGKKQVKKTEVKEEGKAKSEPQPKTEPQKPKEKSTSEQKQKAYDSIDKVANDLSKWLDKFGAKLPEGTEKMGFDQDGIIKLAAQAAKALSATGIEINAAVKKVLREMKSMGVTEGMDELSLALSVRDEINKDATKETPTQTARKLQTEEEAVAKEASERVTGIRNSLLPEGVEESVKSVTDLLKLDSQQVLDNGKALVESRTIIPEVVVNDMLTTPRQLTLDESAAIIYYKFKLLKEIDILLETLNDPKIDKETKSLTELSLNNTMAKLGDLNASTKIAGMLNAQNLWMRSLLVDAEYNLATQVEIMKNFIKKDTLPLDMMERFKEYDAEIRELKKQMEEQQEKINNLQGKLIVPKSTTTRKKVSTNIKGISAKIRKGKIKADLSKLSSSPKPLLDAAWNLGIETVATTFDATGLIVKAVEAGISEIKKTDWYKGLKNKDAANQILNNLYGEYGIQMPILLDDGTVYVSRKYMRDIVESGYDTIETATEKTQEILKAQGIEVTDRVVSDAISDYGKQSHLDPGDISTAIRKLKRIGRLQSALEDVRKKKRPLKSGRERDELGDKERNLMSAINEGLKDIPYTTAESEAMWKSAYEATVKRLENRIKDVNRQIKAEKKDPRKKDSPSGGRIPELKEELKELNKRLNAIDAVETKKLSWEKKVRMLEESLANRIKEKERRIDEGDFTQDPPKLKTTSPKNRDFA